MISHQTTTLRVSSTGIVSQELLDELREELFHKTGQQWARVVSGSMFPLIRSGDRVLIEHVEPEWVRFGDVILFKSSDTGVIHRVVGKRRRVGRLSFLQKGDLNPSLGLVPAEEVLGRVSVVQRDGCTLNLGSGRGRVLQLGLACCSIGTWVTKWMLRRMAHALGLARRCRRLGRLLDKAVALSLGTLIRFLGPK
jgi:signal peptidase I